MSTALIQDRAREIANQMAANGARFTFKPTTHSLSASFTYKFGRGLDLWQCRGLVREAKLDPAIWRTLVDEISRRCNGGAR